jgi:hypothetical protein
MTTVSSEEDLQADLGMRIRSARQGARLSLKQLEMKSNGEFTRSTVGGYERGETAISAARLIRLAWTIRWTMSLRMKPG